MRSRLLIGLGSYMVMRVWSGLFFIREMQALQKVPIGSPPSAELSESRELDSLDMVQGASRHHLIRVFSVSSFLAEEVRLEIPARAHIA